MPHQPLSFVERLREHAQKRPEKVALRLLEKTRVTGLTYAELDARASDVAGFFQARGAAGERALILLPTGLDYVSAFLGALYAGVIAVPAHPPESQRGRHLSRVASLARDARPRFVFTEARDAERVREVLVREPELAGVEFIALDSAELRTTFRPPVITPETLAFLQYTSGSTAAPKGVMVSHGNLLANELAISNAFAMDERDVTISWLPLFHDMGLVGGLLQSLFAGASVVLMSPLRFLERPVRWLEAITEYRGTISGGPDFAYRMCVERIEPEALANLDLSSWRVAFCGSEPIRARTLSAFAERLAPARFSRAALYPCYGLAEATLFVSGGPRAAGMRVDPATGLTCCGAAADGSEVAVLDPQSLERRASGQTGEICVSGPSIAQGYWNQPAASDATFVTREGRRYLRTGDLGFEQAGELYVSGRLKDLVIVRGRNLVPQDVEDVLADEIAPLQLGRIAVFAVPSEHGEAIGVAAELSRAVARTMRPEALCELIAATVHDCVEEPARVVALLSPGTLPRTSSGKLQRSVCAARLLAGELTTLALYRDGCCTTPNTALQARGAP